MSREQLLTYVAAILTTALETEPDFFPESMAYLAMGSNMSAWETVRHLMVASDLVTIEGNVIRLTAKGRDLATKCNAVLAK